MKKLALILFLCLLTTLSYAGENDWKEKLRKAEADFAQIKIEHKIMYRMLSELYIKRLGMQKYYDLLMSEKYEEVQK